jgi:hypothetical protein
MFRILLGPFDDDFDSFSGTFFSMFVIGILGFVERTHFQTTQSPVLTVFLLVVLILIVFIVALVSVTCLIVLLKPLLLAHTLAEWIHCITRRVVCKGTGK